MTAMDPTSSTYQVDPRFSPDKESTWSFPLEDDGWMLAHNAIRGEVACLKVALDYVDKRGSYEKWEVDALQKMWKSHYDHVHAHHRSEDNRFQPAFEERFRFPEAKDVPGHGTITEHMDTICRLFGSLTANECKIQIPSIQQALMSYEKDLLPHLLWEEKMILPLMRAYFTSDEMGRIVQEITKTDPPQSMGAFIHFQGEKRFRRVFMKQVNIPPSVWKSTFQGLYNSFRESFQDPYEALTTGKRVPVRRKLFFLSKLFNK